MMNGGGGGLYQSDDEYEDYQPGKGSYHSGNTSGTLTSSMISNPMSNLSGVGGGHIPSQTGSAFTSVSQVPSGGGRGAGNICCLQDDGRRCQRIAGNASYSKRVQKTVVYKRLKLDVDGTVQHTYICDYHKMVIQNARIRVKKESEDEVHEGDDVPEVDLYQLQVNTLRRYKKHFKISTRPGLNKAQLADILTKHFRTIQVSEKEAVTYFIYTVKSGRNKLDNRQPMDGQQNEYLDRY